MIDSRLLYSIGIVALTTIINSIISFICGFTAGDLYVQLWHGSNNSGVVIGAVVAVLIWLYIRFNHLLFKMEK